LRLGKFQERSSLLTIELVQDTGDGTRAAAAAHGNVELVGVLGHGGSIGGVVRVVWSSMSDSVEMELEVLFTGELGLVMYTRLQMLTEKLWIGNSQALMPRVLE